MQARVMKTLPGRYRRRRDAHLMGVASPCVDCGRPRSLDDCRAARALNRPFLCRWCATRSVRAERAALREQAE
jgi:hypothetical protein